MREAVGARLGGGVMQDFRQLGVGQKLIVKLRAESLSLRA